MHLNAEPFSKIVNGRKTIEIRLNDEKRQALRLGDEIDFMHRDSEEIIKCYITELMPFLTFDELIAAISMADVGRQEGEQTEVVAIMRRHYSAEDEARYGVLGIRFRVISQA
jgi:ASC-1-like (ASCH) protein